MSRTVRCAVVVLSAVTTLGLLATGCADPSDPRGRTAEENLGTAQSELTLDFCTSATAHASSSPSWTYLNSNPNAPPDASVDAAYAYKGGCNRFIVDTYMNKANISKVVIRGSAWDLPSSPQVNGELPATQLDCERFKMWVDFYSRPDTDGSSFTKISGGTFVGWWTSGACSLTRTSGTGLDEIVADSPSDGTTKIFRTAVKTNARGVAQQAAVHHALYQPVPK
jgi:hypothetical protein